MQLKGVKFKAIKDVLYQYRIHGENGISNGFNSNEQRFFIEVARTRYAELKRTANISYAGEDPGMIRPRRRLRGLTNSVTMSIEEGLEQAYCLVDQSPDERISEFARIFNRITPISLTAVQQLTLPIWRLEDNDTSTIDLLRLTKTRFRNKLSTERLALARAYYLELADRGSDRGAVAIAADMAESGDHVGAIRKALLAETIQSPVWKMSLLYTGIKAFFDCAFVPSEFLGAGNVLTIKLRSEMDKITVKEILRLGLESMYMNLSLAVSYINLFSDSQENTFKKHPLIDVVPDCFNLPQQFNAVPTPEASRKVSLGRL